MQVKSILLVNLCLRGSEKNKYYTGGMVSHNSTVFPRLQSTNPTQQGSGETVKPRGIELGRMGLANLGEF